MFIIKNRKIFFIISGILVALSLVLVMTRGLQVGIDFTGGSIIEVSYSDSLDAEKDIQALLPPMQDMYSRAQTIEIGEITIQQTGETGYIFRTKNLSETERLALLSAMSIDGFTLTEERINTVGPTIGQELRSKAWIALTTVVIAIIFFIAYVFRHVSEPVSSWKYGIIAIIALIHDIIIPIGIASLVGVEVDSLFVIALLAILGLSVNDTIVMFDRVRENLRNKISHSFSETIGKSIEQTYMRSINTSVTTLFVVLGLFFFGPDTTKDFALILAVGLVAGTYSSIFLASPLLIVVEKMSKEKE